MRLSYSCSDVFLLNSLHAHVGDRSTFYPYLLAYVKM